MRRVAVLISALSLSIATGTTLLALGVVLSSGPATAVPAPATTADARAFVAALDDALGTGDAAPLDAVLAADFVDHAAGATGVGGRNDLVRTLGLMRASFTDLALSIDDVVADGERAVVRLTFRGTRRPDLHGIPLESTPATWQEIDVLRVAEGKIAERWSAGDSVGLFTELGPAVLAVVAEVPMVALARFTYAPGAGSDGPALPGPGLLVVETGTLTVQGSAGFSIVRTVRAGPGSGSTVVADGTEATAGAGDTIVMPARAPSVRNQGATPAVALGLVLFASPVGDTGVHPLVGGVGVGTATGVMALALAMAGVTGGAALPPGVTVHPVAFGTATALPSGPVMLGLGRALLPPGTSLPAHRAPGLELLIVQAGTLQLDIVPGSVAARSPLAEGVTAGAVPPDTVKAGGTAVFKNETVRTMRGRGDVPLDLLIIVVAPATASE